MAPTCRWERPEATTIKSAMVVLPARSMATMSSALSSSSELSMTVRRLCEAFSALVTLAMTLGSFCCRVVVFRYGPMVS